MKRNKIIALVFILFLVAIFFCVKFFDKNISNANNSKNTDINKTFIPIDAPAKDLRGEAFRKNLYELDPKMHRYSRQFQSFETCDGNKLQEKFLDAIITNDLKNVKKYLKDGADIEGINISGATPLMLAAFHGNIDVANFLIEKGANINFRHLPDNTSVLDCSLEGYNGEVAKLLIAKGADLGTVQDLSPLLMLAAFIDDYDLFNIVLENGADVNYHGKNGISPLLSVTIDDRTIKKDNASKIITILIKKGANVNQEAFLGHSPLIVATMSNRADLAQILLENGADKSKKDNLGRTALDIAKENGNKEIIKLLEK